MILGRDFAQCSQDDVRPAVANDARQAHELALGQEFWINQCVLEDVDHIRDGTQAGAFLAVGVGEQGGYRGVVCIERAHVGGAHDDVCAFPWGEGLAHFVFFDHGGHCRWHELGGADEGWDFGEGVVRLRKGLEGEVAAVACDQGEGVLGWVDLYR